VFVCVCLCVRVYICVCVRLFIHLNIYHSHSIISYVYLSTHQFILTVIHSSIHPLITGVRDMVGKVIQLAAEDSTHNTDGQSSVVIICGTGYIMPDARLELGIKEPRYSLIFSAFLFFYYFYYLPSSLYSLFSLIFLFFILQPYWFSFLYFHIHILPSFLYYLLVQTLYSCL
jgi:hypothetical protein